MINWYLCILKSILSTHKTIQCNTIVGQTKSKTESNAIKTAVMSPIFDSVCQDIADIVESGSFV